MLPIIILQLRVGKLFHQSHHSWSREPAQGATGSCGFSKASHFISVYFGRLHVCQAPHWQHLRKKQPSKLYDDNTDMDIIDKADRFQRMISFHKQGPQEGGQKIPCRPYLIQSGHMSTWRQSSSGLGCRASETGCGMWPSTMWDVMLAVPPSAPTWICIKQLQKDKTSICRYPEQFTWGAVHWKATPTVIVSALHSAAHILGKTKTWTCPGYASKRWNFRCKSTHRLRYNNQAYAFPQQKSSSKLAPLHVPCDGLWQSWKARAHGNGLQTWQALNDHPSHISQTGNHRLAQPPTTVVQVDPPSDQLLLNTSPAGTIHTRLPFHSMSEDFMNQSQSFSLQITSWPFMNSSMISFFFAR